MDDLERFGENLIVIEGPVVRDMGMPFPTRMTVAVLDDGSLPSPRGRRTSISS